jgi:CelD/BcsL family acetyltransferase involved in cellulose biosynthesis
MMVFRRDGEIAGVLPSFLHEWNGQRQMTLVGSGVSDYLDPVFEPAYLGEILELTRAQLRSRGDWDLCDWQDLSRDSPIASLGTPVEDTPCLVIPIEQPFEEFLAGRPTELKRNLRRDEKKAAAVGPVSFEALESTTPELMDALVQLHGARWAKSGEQGMIAANRSEAFLRDVAERFAALGSLRIFSMRFANRIVAILLALRDRTTLYAYLTGFDPEYEKLGFGRQLLAHAVRYAHEQGYRQWDFLRGQEAFKFDWGARVVEKCRLVIRS